LQGVDDELQTPRRHRVLEFLFKTLEAFSDVVDRADGFLENDWLSGCGADDFREPAQGGRFPVGRPA
jgi:hypothetical protein